MWPFKNKIKAQRFFNYEKKILNIKGMKASVPNDQLPVEFSLGEFSSENFPPEVSEKLKNQDMLQYTITNAINSLNEGEEKEKKKIELIDAILAMFKLAQDINEIDSKTYKKKELIEGTDLYDFYSNSDYEIANIVKSDLTNPGLIIWPVTLQDRPTIIHKAQIEIIKTLQINNWELKIIIADCGSNDISDQKITGFLLELEKHLQKRNIKYGKVCLLSEYYQLNLDGDTILKNFIYLSSKIKISDLMRYNNKQETYSPKNTRKVQTRATLKFIQPVLMWSAVILESENYCNNNLGKKAIIIAGKDESNQWKYIFSLKSIIGGIFNIILQDEGKKTIFQEERPMIFHSDDEVLKSLDKGNLAKWLFESFISTPKFPTKLTNLSFCKECKKNKECRNCLFPISSDVKLPNFVDRDKFVESFWGIINPN